MTCIETTFIIDFLKGKKDVEDYWHNLRGGIEPLVITAPTIMELWEGAARDGYPTKKKIKLATVCAALMVLPLDAESAKEAGEIKAALKKAGMMMPTPDIMIAAICKRNGETLLTRDAHYTRIPGLRVLKY